MEKKKSKEEGAELEVTTTKGRIPVLDAGGGAGIGSSCKGGSSFSLVNVVNYQGQGPSFPVVHLLQ